MRTRKILAAFLCVVMAIAMMPNFASAVDYSNVRVKLSNANDGTLNIGVNGNYTIDKNNARITSDILVSVDPVNPNNMIVTSKASGQEVFRGKSFSILCDADQSGKAGTLKIYTTVNSGNGYLGNLSISIKDSSFAVINILPIENYLYGVVPHEMSNEFPVEALKAQAIAARGYAISKIKSGGTYDVLDTPQDQVYRGYDSTKNIAIAAIDATRGQVLTYSNKVIIPFYSASNGGQTELTKNVWNEDLKYYQIKDDPYDLRNPESLNQKIFFPFVVSQQTPLDERLGEFVKTLILPQLKEKGYSTYADQIEIVGFSELDSYDAKFAEPSRSYKSAKGVVDLRVVKADGSTPVPTTGEKIGKQPEMPKFQPAMNNGGEQMVGSSGPLYYNSNGLLLTYDEMQEQLEQYYAELESWENGYITRPGDSGLGMVGTIETISLDFDFLMYDLKDTTKSFKIFTNPQLRMYWSEKTPEGTNLVNCRYGHGVGMSQRGAQQMANEGKTYKEILAFYYTGTALKQLNYTTSDISSAQSSTSSGVITGDEAVIQDEDLGIPDETEIENAQPGAVSGTAQTNLKLTAKANKEAQSIGTIKKNTKLFMISQTGSYFRVADATGKTGYVSMSNVLLDTSQETICAEITKDSSITSQAQNGEFVKNMKKGDRVRIVGKEGTKYAILTDDQQICYISQNNVTILVGEIKIPLDSSKNFGQARQNMIMYKEKTSKTKLLTIPSGDVMEVLYSANDGKAYQVSYKGQKGYVLKANVKLLKKGSIHPNPAQIYGESGSTATTQRVTTNTKIIGNASETAQVTGTVKADILNVRKTSSTAAGTTILVQLERGSTVTVIEQIGSFYKIRTSSGAVGYAAAEYIDIKTTGGTGTVAGVTVRLRKTASTSGTTITILPKGEKVTILSESNGFYKVKTSGGTEGYIAKELVTASAGIPKSSGTSSSASNETSSGSSSSAKAQGTVLAENVNLRQAAASTSKVLKVLKKGTTVDIYAKTKDYYRVSSADTMGYILKSYVGNLKAK